MKALNSAILLAGAGSLALVLAACGNKTADLPDCNDPAVQSALQQSLQQSFFLNVQDWGTHTYQAVVEPNKVVTLWPQFKPQITGIVTDPGAGNNKARVCHASVSVAIPQALLDTAKTQAPLVYGGIDYSSQVSQRAAANQVSMNNAAFSRNISYKVSWDAQHKPTTTFGTADWNPLTQTLATALLPYGLKDQVVVNGVKMSKDKALAMVAQLQSAASSPAAASAPTMSTEVTIPANLPPRQAPMKDANGSDMGVLANAGDGDSVEADSTQDNRAAPGAPVQNDNLNAAVSANSRANQTINRIWRNMDDTVRQSLLSEQRQWIKSKTAACANAGTESARLQCDTRMTQERIQYLRGFSLPEQQ